MANYFKGGKIDKPIIAIPTRFHSVNMTFPHREQSIEDTMTSKTVDCHCYTFELEGTNFHFIDTPGINDTRGLMQDSRNIEKIFTYIDQLSKITALILVLNGAVSRATINIRNVIFTFQQHIPDIMYNHMLIVLTNCQAHTVNFCINDLELPNKCPVFHMQNSAFSSDFKAWSSTTRDTIERDFKDSMNTIGRLILELLQLKPQSTSDFKDVDNHRNSIKRKLHDTRLILMDLKRLEAEIAGYERSADIHSMNMEKFQNFLQHKVVMRLERVPTSFYSTTCSKCNRSCHENCRLNEVPYTGDKSFLGCIAMKRGKCTECHCPAKEHYHDRSVLKLVNRTIYEVASNLGDRYWEAAARKEKANSECNNIQKTIQMIGSQLDSQYEEVKRSVEQLHEKCSALNVSEELWEFIDFLKNDVTKLELTSVIDKANIFIGKLEKLCKDMENTKRPDFVHNGCQRSSSLVRVARKPEMINRRKTLMTQSLTAQSTFESVSITSKSAELSCPEITEAVSTSSNVSASFALRNGGASFVQKTAGDTSTNEFSATEENFELSNESEEHISSSHNVQKLDLQDQIEKPVRKISTLQNEMQEDFSTFTLSALIEASKQTQSKQISKELVQRCHGKALGLLSSDDQLRLCKYFAELQAKASKQLVHLRDQLDEEIQETISYNPFDIELVDKSKLLQLAAVNLIIFDRIDSLN